MRLIDADMVLAKMENTLDMQDLYLPMHFMELVVDEMPTIDPVQHGRWIDDLRGAEEFPLFRKGWKCSVCGSRNTYGKPKYCMNCGARMDGVSNET